MGKKKKKKNANNQKVNITNDIFNVATGDEGIDTALDERMKQSKKDKQKKQNKDSGISIPKIIISLILLTITVLVIGYFVNNYFLFNAYTTKKFIKMGLNIAIVLAGGFGICLLSTEHLFAGVLSIVMAVAMLLGVSFYDSPIFKHEEYRALAGEIKKETFKDDMQVIPLNDLPIISSDVAKNLADKKLGEMTSLGSQMTVGELTIQRVKDTLYYVAPLEFTGYFQWKNNNGVSPGYIMVNAQVENEVHLVNNLNGKDIKMKYLLDSYFEDRLERHAFSLVNNKHLTDFTFELDDEGRPHWVISMYENTLLNKGQKVIGTLIIDAQTGEGKEYTIEETPSWVDRVQPLSVVNKNLNNWGRYVNGAFNFSKKDVVKTTDGYKLIYSNNKCYYYTGITSVGSDESLIGFFLTDTRTGESKMYEVAGAIETSAMASAQGKVQEKEYTATFPLLVNIQNEPTYFMSLLDKKGLIKGYSFVNVKNYNIVSYGETVNASYEDYLNALSNKGSSNLKDNNEVIEIQGIIDRMGATMSGDNLSYNIVLKDNNKIFKVSDKLTEVTVSKIGDEVVLKYIENMANNIAVKEFDNLLIGE